MPRFFAYWETAEEAVARIRAALTALNVWLGMRALLLLDKLECTRPRRAAARVTSSISAATYNEFSGRP